LKKSKKPTLVFLSCLSFILFYAGNRITGLYLTLEGEFVNKILNSTDLIFSEVKKKPFYLYFDKYSLLVGFILVASLWLMYLYNSFGRDNFLIGKEHGSAEWGISSDIRNYIDKKYDQNVLLTETERLSMSNRMLRTKTEDYNRNKNVLVIGGSGSGKTRFYIKPNIMQMHSSFVITDPKGSLIHECGKLLEQNGYKIKVFDLINREKSDKYNPFRYLRSEDDILKLINNLITNTNSPHSKSGGDFWEKSEIALLEAVFGYIFYEAPTEEQTIATALDMIRLAEVKEDNDDFQSPLDIMFEELKNENPDHFAVRQYDIFKLGAGKTAKSILISVGVRLAPFNIQSLRNIVMSDTLELEEIGSEKTALFVLLPDTDKSFNFLAAMMYQQLFDVLVHRADNEYKGRLPYHVRFLLDEFANIGQIPDFHILISTLRSREISVNIVLQNLAQIKSLYEKTWEIITGNCDSLLFLGGMEQSTLEYISKMCGKTTIDNRSFNESKGQSGSVSINNQILGRDLIMPDEVGNISGKQCILKIRQCNPFKSNKFDIEKHARYKYLSDSNKNNWYDISHREKKKVDRFFEDVGDIWNMDVVEPHAGVVDDGSAKDREESSTSLDGAKNTVKNPFSASDTSKLPKPTKDISELNDW
jgi:Type IV secretory pathway, VirD4 components